MGVVYMLHDSGRGLYRVGRTKSLRTRVLTHYKERHGDLRLIWYIVSNDTYILESHFHNEWKSRRVCGEWFDLTPEHVSHFRSVSVVEYTTVSGLTERQRRANTQGRGAKPKYLIEPGEVIRPARWGRRWLQAE